jgi:hypothetical protein
MGWAIHGSLGWAGDPSGGQVGRVPQHQQIVVNSKVDFDMTIQRYISMGYGPRQMSNELAILAKAGDANLGCAFFFWLVFFFPVAIMMYLKNQRDAQESTVTIRLDVSGGSVLPGPGDFSSKMPKELLMTPDRDSWWDGTTWVPADQVAPPMAKKNADGTLWWDGDEWRSVR